MANTMAMDGYVILTKRLNILFFSVFKGYTQKKKHDHPLDF